MRGCPVGHPFSHSDSPGCPYLGQNLRPDPSRTNWDYAPHCAEVATWILRCDVDSGKASPRIPSRDWSR